MTKLYIDLFEQQGWFVADFHDQTLTIRAREEVSAWCRDTYGTPVKTLKSPGRWRDRALDFRVYFRDEADRSLFVLRWN